MTAGAGLKNGSVRGTGLAVRGSETRPDAGPVAEVIGGEGSGPLVVVCEHASPTIPEAFGGLGLAAEAALSHIAWDPGAAELASRLARAFDSPLVRARVSRLVYDLNRPPEAADAMPVQSEIYRVPGNEGLTPAERAARVEAYYRPFEALLDATLAARPGAVLVTVHSFTPVFHGVRRSVEVGIVHDTDARLADAMLGAASGLDVRRNEPYGPTDGVTHTLRRHALPRGLLNVMLEVRNDLLASPGAVDRMAARIGGWLETALVHASEGARA